MKSVLAVLAVVSVMFMAMPDPVMAEVKLPNYANSGSAENKAQSVGKKITDFISLGVGILAIIGMLVGAGYFAVGNRERGWQFLSGGFIALVIAGLVYGIAALTT